MEGCCTSFMMPGRAGFGTSASAIERLDPSTAVPVRGRPWLRWTRDTRACRSAVRACRGSVCAAPGEGPRAVTHSLDSARSRVRVALGLTCSMQTRES